MLSLNTTELKLHLEWLESSGVIELTPEGFRFTGEGQQECKKLGYYVEPNVPVLSKHLPTTHQEWEDLFSDFIIEAKVPMRLEDGKGGVYASNKFSLAAVKVFKAALSSGIQYELLVKSTMLYYKSSLKYKKTIGNYISNGDWKTDYEALKSSAASGTLTEHIKNEISDGNQSGWKLG